MNRIRMTQKEVAERLGFADATFSRWMVGVQIQTRTSDNLLRLFFAFPQVRLELSRDRPDRSLGHSDLVMSNV